MSASIYSDLPSPESPSLPPAPAAEAKQENQTPQEAPGQNVLDSPPANEQVPRRSSKLKLLLPLLIAAAAGWWFFGKSPSPLNGDLAYLPENPLVVVHVKVSQLESCELMTQLRPLTSAFDMAQLGAQQAEGLAGALDTVTLGMATPPGSYDADDAITAGVLHCRRELPLQELIQDFAEQATEESHGEWKVVSFPGVAFCQTDPRTILFGNTAGLRAVLERGMRPATVTEAMRTALEQTDFNRSLAIAATVPPSGVEDIQKFIGFAPPEAFVLMAEINADVALQASLVMPSGDDVKALQERAQPLLAMAKLQSPEVAKVIDSLEFSAAGATLQVTATIPGAPLVQMAQAKATELATRLASRTPVPARKRPGTGPIGQASVAKCQHDLAMLNSAVERYYFDEGTWPTKVQELEPYVSGEVPTTCPAHGLHYTIDPTTHRVSESHRNVATADAAATVVNLSAGVSASTPAAGPATTAVPATTPALAFQGVANAARVGDLRRVLEGFTPAGQEAIAADLAARASEDIAVSSSTNPEIATAFLEIQQTLSPDFQESDGPSRSQLVYLNRIADFLDNHHVEFSGLADIYGPCSLGKVAIEDQFALAVVSFENGDDIRAATVSFLKNGPNWQICVFTEMPREVMETLQTRLEEEDLQEEVDVEAEVEVAIEIDEE